LNKETLKQDLHDFEFNFIELKKFNIAEGELESIVEKWIYFIKNAGNLNMVPKSAEDIPELKEAYAQAAKNAWSLKELEAYEYWQIRDAEDRYILEEKFEKGIEKGIEIGTEKGIEIGTVKGIEIGTEKGIEIGTEKGIEIGTEKGRNEEKFGNARKMKRLGIDTGIIMQVTGLSREEIEGVMMLQ
jgi:predicted transposase/invertase (TIGR01784 family)